MIFTIFETLSVALATVFICLVVMGHALLVSAIYRCLCEDRAFRRRSNRKAPLPVWPSRMAARVSRPTIVATVLMSCVAAAFAQEAPIRADMASIVQRTNLFTETCARRDLQVVTLIEERSDAQEVAASKLFEAYLDMARARIACIEGRESEALSIYDTVGHGLAPTRTAR